MDKTDALLSVASKELRPIVSHAHESQEAETAATAAEEEDFHTKDEFEEEEEEEEEYRERYLDDEYNDNDNNNHRSMIQLEEKREDKLSFTETTNQSSHAAQVAQRLDAAFFSTLRVDRARELSLYPSDEPLLQAIVAEDAIDVQMLLEELGPIAATKVSSRDSEGRTALHIASLGRSPEIVYYLLDAFRKQTYNQLLEELHRLEQERIKSIAELRRVALVNNSVALDSKVFLSRVASIQDWFQCEEARRHRQAELRIEVNMFTTTRRKDSFIS